jgi:hypothetical protein
MLTAHQNKSLSRTAICFGVLLVFIGLLAMARHVQRPNNGDGWRILRSAQIVAPDGYYKNQPFPRFYAFKPLAKIKPVDLVPMSSSAALVEAVSFVERAALFKAFDFLWVTGLYLAIYLFGFYLVLTEIRISLAIPLLFLFANPYVIAYFNSPYEESLLIALCPLLCFLFLRSLQPTRLAMRAVALAMASTKIQFAPALLLGIRDWKFRHNAIYLLLSFLVIGAVAIKAGKFKEPNSYNRYFNGLAYSMADVSGWPANDFVARRAIAQRMTADSEVVLPNDSPEVKRYWGTSFWPTGDRLSASEGKFISDQVGKWYWQTLRDNPRYYDRMLSEPIVTMLKADYRMNYIFDSDTSGPWFGVSAAAMKHFGAIFILMSIFGLIAAAKNRAPKHIVFVAATVLYPWLVVYGDGYYEYEKHLFPVLFLGVVLSLVLCFASFPVELRKQFGTSRKSGEQAAPSALEPAADCN